MVRIEVPLTRRVPMAEFNFQQFDKQGARLVKTPELTIQGKGTIGLNASAYHLMGQPDAIEFLYDPDAKVIGLRPVPEEDVHAYPVRAVGAVKDKDRAKTFLVAGTAFLKYYGIPFGDPVRREVSFVDGVLIVNLNDPGRSAMSNRTRAKLNAERDQELSEGAADDSEIAETEEQQLGLA
jgi:hypothetical protein